MYLLPNLFALLSLVLPFLMTFDSSLRGCMLRIPEVSYCIGDSISMVPKKILYGYCIWNIIS